MDVRRRVFKSLAQLRRELEGVLMGLVEKRSGLEGGPEVLDKDIESTRRQLELVQATAEHLAAQGRGQRAIERGGPGASTQVRGVAKLQILTRVLPT
jgi:hypothetical protein